MDEEEWLDELDDEAHVAPWSWSWTRFTGHALAFAASLADATSTFLNCVAQEVSAHVNYGIDREYFQEEARREMESILDGDE